MSHDAGASIEKVQSALSYVSPDDRDTWWRVGMAIKSGLGDAGFWVWDDWGQLADNYSAKASKSVWKSIKPGGKVGIGTLFFMAKDRGWTWDKPERKLTAAEVEAMREASRLKAEAAAAEKAQQQAIAAERARAIWDASEPAEGHPYLTRKKVAAHGLRIGKWEVTDQETGEVRLITPSALLVPIKDRTGKLWSLQAIFPRKIMGGRDKDYLAGGAKSGHFHAIGRPVDVGGRKVFIITEGYATGASIHQATGHCVLVCFDASNLLAVASSIRERQADAVILLAADNDQFNKRRDGTPYNPGVEAATRAAAEVSGLLAVPQFSALDGEPTDFNDLSAREGDGAVKAQITAALGGQVVEPEPELDDAPPWEGELSFEQLAAPDAPADDEPAIPKEELDELPQAKNKHFTILGYDHGDYYFFIHSKQQVMKFRRVDFNDMGFIEIANDINWWEMNFGTNKNGGVNAKAVFQWIRSVAETRGVYDHTKVRGRGAWLDNGRSIYHLGDILLVDGVPTEIDAIDKSAYVYPRGRKMPRPSLVPLTAEEGRKLFQVARMVRWSMQGSAVLLAGWTFLAPICGALKWRPHIWINGPAGSGKSTVQRDFCHGLTRDISIYAQGNSTEAGIRQKLHSDALAVLVDEFESNNDKEKSRVESILSLIRQSSSESQAETMKGTAGGDGINFHIRSMFCLASINTNLEKQADRDRITKLTIRVPPKDGSEVGHWHRLEKELHDIVNDESLPGKLLARSQSMLKTVIASIRIFCEVGAKLFHSQRMGDQYGTLIAGCWCLCNDRAPTEEEAAKMIAAYDWKEHTEDSDHDDAVDALQNIMWTKIRIGGSVPDVTVAELVKESVLQGTGVVESGAARDALSRHGIRVEKLGSPAIDMIAFGITNKNLKIMLKDTPYSTDIRGQLLRIKGSIRGDTTMSFGGASSRFIAVPMSAAIHVDGVPMPPSAGAIPPALDDDYPI